MTKLVPALRVQGMQESVWVEFTRLSSRDNPVNLGLGYPDFPPPEFVVKALQDAISRSEQDCSMHQHQEKSSGLPHLVESLGKLYSKMTMRDIDVQNEVLVTVGGSEAIYCAVLGLVKPGDEVIIIEPYFDQYEPLVLIAGGVPVFIPLRPSEAEGNISSADWSLDPAELASKFNPKTRMILVNTPHNPIGKVFSREELEVVAKLCMKHDVICVMDEVYEWVVYGGSKHFRMNTLPGMWNRTVTIGSAGKALNITGWKVGWAYGARQLIEAMKRVHQFCVSELSAILQEAVAVALEEQMARMDGHESYWKQLSSMLEKKRDRLCSFLSSVGMAPIVPQGGYFIVADFSNLAAKVELDGEGTKDFCFARGLSRTKKLHGIPVSAFYGNEHKVLAQDLIRFCFAKEDSTLEQAVDILEKMKASAS